MAEGITIEELMDLYAEHDRQQRELIPPGYDAIGDAITEDPMWSQPTHPGALVDQWMRAKGGKQFYDAEAMPEGYRAVRPEMDESSVYDQRRQGFGPFNVSPDAVNSSIPNDWSEDSPWVEKPPTRRRT
jgi:hypothetical protein